MLTFLPVGTFNQFRKTSYLYFLMIAVLQSIPAISPFHPFSAIAPLLFVVGVSMIREAYEDYKRYLSDKDTNSQVT